MKTERIEKCQIIEDFILCPLYADSYQHSNQAGERAMLRQPFSLAVVAGKHNIGL